MKDEEIDKAVKRTIDEYGDTLKMLANKPLADKELKEQKKRVIRIIDERIIPSAIFTFNEESYFSTADVGENVKEIKRLIKEL